MKLVADASVRRCERDLISAAQVLLQLERLKIASSLKEAATLTAELPAFKLSASLEEHASYGSDMRPRL